MAVEATGNLAHDTTVTKLSSAPGWYTAALDDSWNFRTPSGGVLMTIAMRAMQAELDLPDFRPISANTHFCSPVPAGPLQIRVEVLRSGGIAAQVRAQLSSTSVPGPGLEVSATFGRDRSGVDVMDADRPLVAGPTELPPMDRPKMLSADSTPAFFDNFEVRLAKGNPWWTSDWEPGPARMARWFRYRTTQALPDGRLDPLAIPPVADTMPPALIQKLGPDREPFHAPSLDLTVHFLEDTNSQWLLTDVHAVRARGGWASAQSQIWDDQGRLVAVATQMMILRRAPMQIRVNASNPASAA